MATGHGGENRAALVIGNDKYRHLEPLKNAVADAQALRRELTARGFQVVYRENADRRAMNDAIGEFLGKLSSDTVGVLFYAGHGAQVNGMNYLLPVDLEKPHVVDDGIDLGRTVERMSERGTHFSLAIVDACRNNPLSSQGRSAGESPGLAPPSFSARGVMIVYSAGSNQTALDRLGDGDEDPNGVFTRVLVKALRRPGASVADVVTATKREVAELARRVGHTQTPAVYDESLGNFVFTPAGEGSPTAPAIEVEDALVGEAPAWKPHWTLWPAAGVTVAAAGTSLALALMAKSRADDGDPMTDPGPTATGANAAWTIAGGGLVAVAISVLLGLE